MNIGPLEYVVIGFQDNQFTSEVLPVLGAIQEKGAIRVVDKRAHAGTGFSRVACGNHGTCGY
jgi:hypothetical protein